MGNKPLQAVAADQRSSTSDVVENAKPTQQDWLERSSREA